MAVDQRRVFLALMRTDLDNGSLPSQTSAEFTSRGETAFARHLPSLRPCPHLGDSRRLNLIVHRMSFDPDRGGRGEHSKSEPNFDLRSYLGPDSRVEVAENDRVEIAKTLWRYVRARQPDTINSSVATMLEQGVKLNILTHFTISELLDLCHIFRGFLNVSDDEWDRATEAVNQEIEEGLN